MLATFGAFWRGQHSLHGAIGTCHAVCFLCRVLCCFLQNKQIRVGNFPCYRRRFDVLLLQRSRPVFHPCFRADDSWVLFVCGGANQSNQLLQGRVVDVWQPSFAKRHRSANGLQSFQKTVPTFGNFPFHEKLFCGNVRWLHFQGTSASCIEPSMLRKRVSAMQTAHPLLAKRRCANGKGLFATVAMRT